VSFATFLWQSKAIGSRSIPETTDAMATRTIGRGLALKT
jgi:hypothetical protein